ncbi:MAG: Hsp20/alpha crystallin family protein [Gammaproteobacteria bacterium]|nr:Hsp20/alpha crystallin family protein [Gammaproteobacteria bacterium]
MQLTEYEPLALLNRLSRHFSHPGRFLPTDFNDEESNVFTSRWMPAVDIKEEDHQFTIRADVPGVAPEEIEVTANNGILTIKGDRKSESRDEKDGYKRVERTSGSFYRRFSLPDSAATDKIQAKSRNGVLELIIPKQDAVKAKKITVKS